MDFSRLEAYHGLNRYYRKNDIHSHIFYFAVAPRFFSIITEGLKLVHGSSSGKVILEKPFGENLAAAAALNKELEAFFGPEHIYRIDHYLGKEMVRNIQAIRFSNPILQTYGIPAILNLCRFPPWRIWAWKPAADTMMPAAP